MSGRCGGCVLGLGPMHHLFNESCDLRKVEVEPDPVNSPSHYTWLPVEVIEITEHLDFLLGNVVKYVLRADHKGKPVEDLKKARWYIDRAIKRREEMGDVS